HEPALHTRVAQSRWAGAGQSLALTQPVQWPLPSHTLLPPQLVPPAVGGVLRAPLVHTSVVHRVPSTGTSLLSITDTRPPAPSHSTTSPSPLICDEAGEPAAVYAMPQVPAVHVRCAQSVSWPGQLLAVKHDTHAPLPSHTLPPF